VIQLSVLLVGSQQGFHVYFTAIAVPYKMAVSMWKIVYFRVWCTDCAHAGTRGLYSTQVATV